MSYPNRRQHVGNDTTATGRTAPPPPTIAEVGIPPAPLPPTVALVDATGKPTMDYYQWQMKMHDWRMKLWTHLGGSLEPPPETP
jgi:hypothetical protein